MDAEHEPGGLHGEAPRGLYKALTDEIAPEGVDDDDSSVSGELSYDDEDSGEEELTGDSSFCDDDDRDDVDEELHKASFSLTVERLCCGDKDGSYEETNMAVLKARMALLALAKRINREREIVDLGVTKCTELLDKFSGMSVTHHDDETGEQWLEFVGEGVCWLLYTSPSPRD